MTRILPFSDSLTRELSRLRRLELDAVKAGDIPTFLHSRLRWCELILTLCPGVTAAAPELGRRLAEFLPQPPPAVPRWRLEQRARPLVPIVRREVTIVKTPQGSHYQTAREELACGHIREVLVMVDTDRTARHRRCAQCGALRMAALDLRTRKTAKVLQYPAPAAAGNSVMKGGRGESPERERAGGTGRLPALMATRR